MMLNGCDRHVLSQDRDQPAPSNHSVLFCMEHIIPWDEPQQAVPIVCLACLHSKSLSLRLCLAHNIRSVPQWVQTALANSP